MAVVSSSLEEKTPRGMKYTPLAERLRPKTFDDFIGQEHVIGEKGSLRQAIRHGLMPSMIFWGPPGVGKTTLAEIIANTSKRAFYTLSAISSGVKDVREVIKKASTGGMFNENPILFIDEIHRFSKSQQDSLLGAVEKGTITLIGATTENPSFEVNSALLSRCQVYVLKPFTAESLHTLIDRAFEKDDILKKANLQLKEREALLKYSGGDARRLLNLIELAANEAQQDQGKIDNDLVEKLVQENPAVYDKDGEQHYDIISAFIKSMRGSDPNAAVYWLARMIAGGEDPKFIARRMIIFASEDIGNANPNAILLANTCFESVAKIGMPESRIILSQCATYLASSVKSNASYMAINKAQAQVSETGNLPVPLPLRNAPTKLMKELDYGKQYKYAHDHPGNFAFQEHLPDEISKTVFYDPGDNAKENDIRKRLRNWWKNHYDY